MINSRKQKGSREEEKVEAPLVEGLAVRRGLA